MFAKDRTVRRVAEHVFFTLGSLVFLGVCAYFVLQKQLPSAMGVGGGFLAYMALCWLIFRFSIPRERRQRDPFPWDKKLLRMGGKIDDLRTSITDLEFSGRDVEVRNWTAVAIGQYGTWKLSVRDTLGVIDGVAWYYHHNTSTTLDAGFSAGTLDPG